MTLDRYKINKICWATGSDCAGELTKEHVISDSILKFFGPINVNKGAVSKTLGKGSYVIRNLCEHHNNELSKYDAEMLKLMVGMDALFSKGEFEHIEQLDTGQQVLRINGSSIERWFAKTLMNTAISDAKIFRHENPPYYLSSKNINEQLFGNKTFSKPYGLRLGKTNPRIGGNAKAGIQLGLNYCQVNHFHSQLSEWRPYSVPSLFYLAYNGIELAGFFNVTEFDDDFAQAHFHAAFRDHLEKCALQKPFKFGFTLEGEQDYGDMGPARIIDFLW